MLICTERNAYRREYTLVHAHAHTHTYLCKKERWRVPTYLHGFIVVLSGEVANVKFKYPVKEPSSDTMLRYNSFGKKLEVNAIRNA